MVSAYYHSQIVATTLDQLALFLISASIQMKNSLLLLVGAIIGGLGYYRVGWAIKNNGLGKSNGTWNLLSTVCGTLLGYLFFNEVITIKQFIGIILACVSLYLLDGKS